MKDREYMKLVLEEAQKGCGWVNPNPMVGAVIVCGGKVIAKGHHKKYGGPHAEREALACLESVPQGAVMYVSLEPCCHHGKTPPCTDAILQSGISKVVIGTEDPNPLVAGKGAEVLRKQGVLVETGVLEEECRELNEVFFHYIQNRTPFVVMKYAMTLDGKIATWSGKSKWITSEAAREHAHMLRHRYSAVMAGIGTVIADDPLLNCRLQNGKDPTRIICDTELRLPLRSKIAVTARDVGTIVATASENCEKAKRLEDMGVRIIRVAKKGDHIDLAQLMQRLGNEGIDSILLEGGAALHASALESGIVQRVKAYIAPKVFGGETAKSPIGGIGAERPEQAVMLSDPKITKLGEDILLEYQIKQEEKRCLQE